MSVKYARAILTSLHYTLSTRIFLIVETTWGGADFAMVAVWKGWEIGPKKFGVTFYVWCFWELAKFGFAFHELINEWLIVKIFQGCKPHIACAPVNDGDDIYDSSILWIVFIAYVTVGFMEKNRSGDEILTF